MSGYKQRYLEADRQVQALTAEVQRLQGLLNSEPDGVRQELERTRLIVDLAGIAKHMRVERFTPQQWKQRGHLPPVDFPSINEPLWYATTIRDRFAIPTGRIWYEDFAPEELSPVA